MAGHIDHGKTTLTKALTKIDTDRLKEEQERQISIELGFAPLYEDDQLQISVIDVPGHERFVRQMIAGVTGIDLVVLVVAADEGVMPQTSEHLDILRFLGIENGIVAITKIDRVDEEFLELVKEDIYEELTGTVFADAPYILVDSLSGKGIAELKQLIIEKLTALSMRDAKGAFRLPIDQVFTVKGQGTVVRGTVYEGTVSEGDTLTILPKGLEVRARQLQVHHEKAAVAYAGQRVAINLSNVSRTDVVRGDVLVSSDHFVVTNMIDVAVKMVADLDHLVKQRMPIKLHIGTAEVMGRIVFFDRNVLKEETGEVLCQLRLERDIVTKRGDRFIIRRPSPQETIGGGWVIDAKGERYRFGEQTISTLEKKKVGSPLERITDTLISKKALTITELIKETSLDEQTLTNELNKEIFINFNNEQYTMKPIVETIIEELREQLLIYHDKYPLRQGLNRAELFHHLKQYPNVLLDFVLNNGMENNQFYQSGQYIADQSFQPHVPNNWLKRTEDMLEQLKNDQMQVKYLSNYIDDAGISAEISNDLVQYLENEKIIIALDKVYYWHNDVFQFALTKMKEQLGSEFAIADVRDVLKITRKYLIPFLETLDSYGITKRQGNTRIWLN